MDFREALERGECNLEEELDKAYAEMERIGKLLDRVHNPKDEKDLEDAVSILLDM